MKSNIFRKTINSSRDLTVDNLTVNGTSSVPGYVDLNSPQTLTNKTISGSANTITNIGNSSLSSGIDAIKISSGLISNTEFDFLNNVSSNIQDQINNRVTLDTNQTITGSKLFTTYSNCDISTGAFAVRSASDASFLHTLSYGVSGASVRVCTSDDNITRTGFDIGFNAGNLRAGGFTPKYYLSFLSSANTTRIDIDAIRFLDMTSSNFNLKNLNTIDMGTGTKIGRILQDATQLNQTNNIYLPVNTDVELKYLEGMSGTTIQSQLSAKVYTTTTQTVAGLKTFTDNFTLETTVNNNDPLRIKTLIGTTTGLSFENAFSVDKVKINKANDDLSFVISNVERLRLIANDLNLTNGGEIQYGGTSLKNVSETLTNKTISFASNTLTNVCSTNTSQTISANKNYGGVNLLIDSQVVPKNNITTSGPTVNSDETANYSRGSLWYRSTQKSFYRAQDVATGAAYWQNLNRREITFSYFSTTSASYQPFVYFYASEKFFNKFTVTTYGDGNHKVQLYNITSGAALQETATISSGTQTTTTTIFGGPFSLSPNTFLRLEIKSDVGGETSAAFCATIE